MKQKLFLLIALFLALWQGAQAMKLDTLWSVNYYEKYGVVLNNLHLSQDGQYVYGTTENEYGDQVLKFKASDGSLVKVYSKFEYLSFDLSHDGKYLVYGITKFGVRILDSETGEIYKELKLPNYIITLKDSVFYVQSVSMSYDNHYVAAMARNGYTYYVFVYDLLADTVRNIQIASPNPSAQGNYFYGDQLKFNVNNNILAITSDGYPLAKTILYDADNDKIIHEFSYSLYYDNSGYILFSPDGSKFLKGELGFIRIWDVSNYKTYDILHTIPDLQSYNSFHFVDNNNLFICSPSSNLNTNLQIIDLLKNKVVDSLTINGYWGPIICGLPNNDKIYMLTGPTILNFKFTTETGVDKNQDRGMLNEAQPNPFNEELNITNTDYSDLSVKLYDSNANLAGSYETNDNLSINTSSYPAGTYFCHISTPKSSRTIKLIKVR